METLDEEFVSEEEADGGPIAIKKLRERLAKVVEEKQEYLLGWQRAQADFANYKRQEVSMHEDKEARTKATFVEQLLPALDSFEMALRHSPTKELELVHKQLQNSLTALGVEQFGQPGNPFDPRLHEALQQVVTDKEDEDHIIESVQRSGYTIGDHVIRPAQVTIKNFNN